MSWPWKSGQRSRKVIGTDTYRSDNIAPLWLSDYRCFKQVSSFDRPKLFQFGATSLPRRQSQCDIPHWVMWRGATVTANNRHRWSMTYDFLLTFHSKKGLSSTVSEINGDFSRKSQKNPPRVFCASAEGVPLGTGYWRWGSKTQWWSYRAEKEVWRYLQPSGYNPPTWQTDGQTPADSKDCAYA